MEIRLPHYGRGYHLITQELLSRLPQLPENGLLNLFIKHTSAALTINENADPDVVRDLKLALADIFPDRRDFKHAEGNSAAHLKSSAIGASETIPVAGGTMALGSWQGIYFCEFDGPRHRKVCVQVVGE